MRDGVVGMAIVVTVYFPASSGSVRGQQYGKGGTGKGRRTSLEAARHVALFARFTKQPYDEIVSSGSCYVALKR